MTHSPFLTHGHDRDARWLITCDHATNLVPHHVNEGCLGLGADDMGRHIAYDIGAAGVTRHLADRLQATAVLANFSRLVIDPNRGEHDPTLLMRIYDGSVIPGNRHAVAEEKERRLEMLHRPYHGKVQELAARRNDTVIVSIHSFTRQLRGRPLRPWHVSVLHSKDRRFSDPVLHRLTQETDMTVGDDQPYFGDLPGDAIDRHGTGQKRPHVLIEIRNDLIVDEIGQSQWADRLAPVLQDALASSGL